MKLVSSLLCGPESAHDLLSARDFHRGEEKTDRSFDSAHAVLAPLSQYLAHHYDIFYLCVHLPKLQSLQYLLYDNIRALAGDVPSALTGCRWSNLCDGLGGNVRIFPHLLHAVWSALARGALEQKCYQTNSAMKKYEPTLTRLGAVFLMTSIR